MQSGVPSQSQAIGMQLMTSHWNNPSAHIGAFIEGLEGLAVTTPPNLLQMTGKETRMLL